MLNTLLKRKLTDDQLANLFVNMLLDSVDASYDEVVNLIKDDVAFVARPKPETLGMDHLILIVFGANMTLAQNVLDVEPAAALNRLVVRKLANVFEMNEAEFTPLLKDYQPFCTVPKILGFDYILDSTEQPYLLEVNRFPGLEPRSAMDSDVKHAVVYDAWIAASDRAGIPKECIRNLRPQNYNGFSLKRIDMT